MFSVTHFYSLVQLYLYVSTIYLFFFPIFFVTLLNSSLRVGAPLLWSVSFGCKASVWRGALTHLLPPEASCGVKTAGGAAAAFERKRQCFLFKPSINQRFACTVDLRVYYELPATSLFLTGARASPRVSTQPLNVSVWCYCDVFAYLESWQSLIKHRRYRGQPSYFAPKQCMQCVRHMYWRQEQCKRVRVRPSRVFLSHYYAGHLRFPAPFFAACVQLRARALPVVWSGWELIALYIEVYVCGGLRLDGAGEKGGLLSILTRVTQAAPYVSSIWVCIQLLICVLRGPNEGLNPSECGCFCVRGWCKEEKQEVRYNVDWNGSLTGCVCVCVCVCVMVSCPRAVRLQHHHGIPKLFLNQTLLRKDLLVTRYVCVCHHLFCAFPQFTFSYAYQPWGFQSTAGRGRRELHCS